MTATPNPHQGRVRVAIVGVGNCASALIQGLHKYRDAEPDAFVPGLMHVNLGGYHVRDIEIVAAFDVDSRKVGLDVAEAIFTEPNNTVRFADVPPLGVTVQRGMTHDGLGTYLSQVIEESPEPPVDVAAALRESGAQVLVNYLPVGSEQATRWYMEQALAAGCGVVNCIPVFIAREAGWRRRFEEMGLPIIGDDIKSQVGATIVHRVLARLFQDRLPKPCPPTRAPPRWSLLNRARGRCRPASPRPPDSASVSLRFAR
jgi:myo-inositol-1-phosphate synthase